MRSFLTRVLFVVLDSHRYTLCCECVNDEFIYITPLSVFGTVFVGTGALVSNNCASTEVTRLLGKAAAVCEVLIGTCRSVLVVRVLLSASCILELATTWWRRCSA